MMGAEMGSPGLGGEEVGVPRARWRGDGVPGTRWGRRRGSPAIDGGGDGVPRMQCGCVEMGVFGARWSVQMVVPGTQWGCAQVPGLRGRCGRFAAYALLTLGAGSLIFVGLPWAAAARSVAALVCVH